jgi:hypothetical protein
MMTADRYLLCQAAGFILHSKVKNNRTKERCANALMTIDGAIPGFFARRI